MKGGEQGNEQIYAGKRLRTRNQSATWWTEATNGKRRKRREKEKTEDKTNERDP